MSKPTPEDMETAAEWLDCYDGEMDGLDVPCKRVADWLRAQAYDARLKSVAREAGIPIKFARKATVLRRTPK